MKAWHTFIKHETGEDALHVIVFAETRAQAKYKSEAYGEVDWTDITAIRVPQYDQYEETGRIPREAMVKDGWVFDCDGCGGSLSANNYKDGKVFCDYCIESSE